MTSAGSANVAYVIETSYFTLPGAPTYYLPGYDPQFQALSFDNNLSRLRYPGDIEPSATVAENFEGAWSASWVLSGNQFHDLFFNNDSDGSSLNDSFTTGAAQSSTWYTGVEALDGGTVTKYERELLGCVVNDVSVVYNTNAEVRVEMGGFYGDESKTSGSFTPGSITKSSTPSPDHGLVLDIDGTNVSKLQSARLTWSDVARLRTEPGTRNPVDAVVGPVEPTLETTAIFDGDDHLELAYGASGSSGPQTDMGTVSGTLNVTDDTGATVAKYNLSGMSPQNYDWQDLITPDADLTEPITWAVNTADADA